MKRILEECLTYDCYMYTCIRRKPSRKRTKVYLWSDVDEL